MNAGPNPADRDQNAAIPRPAAARKRTETHGEHRIEPDTLQLEFQSPENRSLNTLVSDGQFARFTPPRNSCCWSPSGWRFSRNPSVVIWRLASP